MSLRRQISFTSTIREMKQDRAVIPTGFLAARAHVTAMARARKLSVPTPTGACDRAAIMSLAVGAARAQQTRTGEAWAVCMSAALKAAWHAAKVARLTRAH